MAESGRMGRSDPTPPEAAGPFRWWVRRTPRRRRVNAHSIRPRLSRRHLLAASAGASVLAAGWRPPASQSALAQDTAGTPQPGGVYRLLGSGDVRGLDPGSAEGSEDWWS